jgi:AraC-like DNA-binding protein
MKTDTILLRAHALMAVYTKAAGVYACVYDHNYKSTAKISEEKLKRGDFCLSCSKQKKCAEAVSGTEGFPGDPCGDIHENAVNECHRLGALHNYCCPFGLMFWASPIYFNGHFIGALMGGGLIKEEKRKIKGLGELMNTCAKSLSSQSENMTMKSRAKQQSDLLAKIEELKIQFPQGITSPEYPLDKEQKLQEALHLGDSETAKQILNEILAVLLFSYPNQFKCIQFKAIELVVLLSRLGINSAFTLKTMLENDSQYLFSIQKTKNIEELTEALYQIVDDLAGQMQCFQGLRHAAALKKADNFILENFTRKISLEEIAKASGFSAPYFSTIFKEEMGENLSRYLNRLRVEKAAKLLKDTNQSLSKIARVCGYEDQSWFSKIFKTYAGMSPGKYRSQKEKLLPKIQDIGYRRKKVCRGQIG